MRVYPLGAGQPSETGAKAYHLDLALQHGLKVPPGIAVVVKSTDSQEYQSLANEAVDRLGQGPFAVRSSFRGEDSALASQAGRYDSFLYVAPSELAETIQKVYASAGTDHHGAQGVVIQKMIEPKLAGVMFCQPDFLDPLVSYVEGTADKLVGGEEQGITEELAPGGEDWRGRLVALAQDLEKKFEPNPLGWDIEWADDGSICWLVQARPITQAPLRDELFSYANIREIMPDPPSVFMASVVEKAGLTLYEYYRNFDPALPATRPIIELQLGRPLFNISLLCETMRHWGLPTRLVTDQIGGADVVGAPLDMNRLASKWLPIGKQGLAQFMAVYKTEQAIRDLRHWRAGDTLGEVGEQVVELFHHLVTVMLDLTAAMAVPLTLLRKLGVLSEHSAHHETPTGQLLRGLEPLRALVAENPDWHESLQQGTAPDDPRFLAPWRQYLTSHGHRGFFESDLAQPRFEEEPELILRSLLTPPLPQRESERSLKGWCTLPLWLYAKRVLDTRERWRDEAMKVYQDLRQRILKLAANQELFEPKKIFDLSLQEWKALDAGWTPEVKFWEERKTEIEELHAYQVPDLMRRFHPRHTLLENLDNSKLDRRVSGMSLTKGTVIGKVWLASDAREQPLFETDEPIVLVVRTVDPGWLFSLPKIAGAIVELGGDLSHGSILLREFGVPAITNAANATRVFQTGDEVKLVAHEGFAVRLSR